MMRFSIVSWRYAKYIRTIFYATFVADTAVIQRAQQSLTARAGQSAARNRRITLLYAILCAALLYIYLLYNIRTVMVVYDGDGDGRMQRPLLVVASAATAACVVVDDDDGMGYT